MMRRSNVRGFRLLGSTATLLLCACHAATGVGGAEALALGAGQERQLSGSAVYVSMGNVTEDSRCPADVTCIWQGNAAVTIGMRTGSDPATTYTLNTTTSPTRISALGYEVRLDSLLRSASGAYIAYVTVVPLKP